MQALTLRAKLPASDRSADDNPEVTLRVPMQVIRLQTRGGMVSAHVMSKQEIASIYPNQLR
jgi:hypothetical protein